MSEPSRRTLLELSVGAAGLALAPACSRRDPPAPRAVDTTVVRIASVPTAVEGELLPALIHDFSGRVELSVSSDVYAAAREGRADLVVSHYGHRDCERFVLDGLGEWPRTVFSNQMAVVGPPADPARIRGLADAAEAFERIATTRSPFVVNDLDGVRYLTEILWQCIGRPERAGWFIDSKQQREDAMALAARLSGYSLWGLTPFLRSHRQRAFPLEPLVLADPLLQRLMVSVIVRVPGCNAEGALALQSHLLAPATQARIRATRYPTDQPVCWTPAGRHNRTAVLPLG